VGNVVELLDLDPTAESQEEGANIDLDATRVGKSAVIKTSTRQTIFLPLIGLVDPEQLKPGDLIGVNKDSYLVLDTLPAEYDSRVKAMEVDEKPTEKYTDVGGLDKQIEELVEAIVWPMKEAERFKKIGIKAPKGMQQPAPVDDIVLIHQVLLCTDLLVLERHSSPEPVPLKLMLPSSNSRARNLYKCSLEMGRS
jgi:26S proteasome regulatory subunit T5